MKTGNQIRNYITRNTCHYVTNEVYDAIVRTTTYEVINVPWVLLYTTTADCVFRSVLMNINAYLNENLQ